MHLSEIRKPEYTRQKIIVLYVCSRSKKTLLRRLGWVGGDERNTCRGENSNSSFSALSQDAINLCATNPSTPNPVETAFSSNPDGNDIFKLDLYYETFGLNFGSPTGQRNGKKEQMAIQLSQNKKLTQLF